MVHCKGDQENRYINKDILSPFLLNKVEIRRKNRLSHQHYEIVNTDTRMNSSQLVQRFTKKLTNNTVYGHRILISNGYKMLSVLEPKEDGGCSKHQTATVYESSKQRECLVAINAGFFNEDTGQCFGNIISDGELINQFRGLKSVNFGIRDDGSIVTGYLKETDFKEMRHPLLQLVTGVGWILRRGENYLSTSKQHEQCNLDNLQNFFEVRTARTFLGHDSKGNVHIVQVEGKTGLYGISLYESVELLKSFNLVNVINLNGAGSSTLVINDTVVNYPGNTCYNDEGRSNLCDTKVSTILCVHKPDSCIPGQSCSGRGTCFKGKCKCHNDWSGKDCEFNGKMLEKCCWRNYNIVIFMSAFIGASVVINVVLCDLFMLYRFRSKDMTQPRRKPKDRLRTYLKETSIISDDESTDILTSAENLLATTSSL